MNRRPGVYLLLFWLLLITACQKDDLKTDYDYKKLGTSARDLLSSKNYTSLQIEIGFMPGYEPETASLDSLTNFLKQNLNKTDGIRIISRAIENGNPSLALNDIVNIEKKNRKFFTNGNTLSVYVLITDADFIPDETLLGLSYWNTSFCLFGKNVEERSGRQGQITRSKLYSILLQHEFGHLLGLVGQGSPMQLDHRDNDNGAHCKNSTCLMYYGIETADNLIVGSTIPKLDAHCMADLKANGGK